MTLFFVLWAVRLIFHIGGAAADPFVLTTDDCSSGSVTNGKVTYCQNDDGPMDEFKNKVLAGLDPKSDAKSQLESHNKAMTREATALYTREAGQWKAALAELPSKVKFAMTVAVDSQPGCEGNNERKGKSFCAWRALEDINAQLLPALVSDKGCESITAEPIQHTCIGALKARCGKKADAQCRLNLRAELTKGAAGLKAAAATSAIVNGGHRWCLNAFSGLSCGADFGAAENAVPLVAMGEVSYAHWEPKTAGAQDQNVSRNAVKAPVKAQLKTAEKVPPKPLVKTPVAPAPPPKVAQQQPPPAVPAGTPPPPAAPRAIPEGKDDPKAHPSIRHPSDSAYGRILDNCRLGWMDLPEYERKLQPWQVCDRLRSSELGVFTPEIAYLLSNASIESYIEILRMEAITRFLQANRDLTGTDITPAMLKNGCPVFAGGIERFSKQPMPGPGLLQDHEYGKKMHTAAERAVREVKVINTIPRIHNTHETCSNSAGDVDICQRYHRGTAYCDEVLSRPRARNKEQLLLYAEREDFWAVCSTPRDLEYDALNAYRDEVTKTLQDYPGLAAGRDATEKPWDKTPPLLDKFRWAKDDAAVDEALVASRKQVSSDLVDAINKFCTEITHDSDWRGLVQLSNLTGSVLKEFPVFQSLQDCAVWQDSEDQKLKSFAKIFTMVGCGVATLASAGIAGPGCAVLFFGEAYVGWKDAKKDLNWKTLCMQANAGNPGWQNTVCSAKDYAKAVDKYDAAVTELAINGAFAAFEAVGMGMKGVAAISKLRRAASRLRPSELGRVTKFLQSAKTPEEIEALSESLDAIGIERAAGTGRKGTEAVDAAIADARTVRSGGVEARYAHQLEGATDAERAQGVRTIEALENAGYTEDEIGMMLNKAKQGCPL
ncbi:MAG: hypothetical protein HY074_20150 [Deltaproteobacteria bacterium]|nr:hypothetical protein [Deltaproteobacteria bacterium]